MLQCFAAVFFDDTMCFEQLSPEVLSLFSRTENFLRSGPQLTVLLVEQPNFFHSTPLSIQLDCLFESKSCFTQILSFLQQKFAVTFTINKILTVSKSMQET